MKRLITAAFCAALTAPFMTAQDQKIEANVPFEFHVCNRLLPHGSYAIRNNGVAIVVDKANSGRGICLVLSHAAGDVSSRHEARLVFDRIGNEYFLRDVYYGYQTTGQELPVSSREKELIAKAPGKVYAEETILAASRK
jgi:hypothetical protein